MKFIVKVYELDSKTGKKTLEREIECNTEKKAKEEKRQAELDSVQVLCWNCSFIAEIEEGN